jgi:hypothetical protein
MLVQRTHAQYTQTVSLYLYLSITHTHTLSLSFWIPGSFLSQALFITQRTLLELVDLLAVHP